MTCECGKEYKDWMPRERYNKAKEKLHAIESQLETTEGENAELKRNAAGLEAIQQRAEQAEQSLERERTAAGHYRAVVGMGLPPDDSFIGGLVAHHAALPEDGRPEFADMVAAFREAPDEAPLLFRPHFQGPSEQPPPQTPAAAPGTPSTNRKALGVPAAGGDALTRQQINELDDATFAKQFMPNLKLT